MKVLIAEDDPISLRILDKTLQKLGYEVVATQNGLEAWHTLQTADPPPLAILDWMMPEMDGIELIKKIRAEFTNGYMFIILLTAKSMKEDIVKGIISGADDYLIKPFDSEELCARLRSGERIIRLERKLAQQNKLLKAVNKDLAAINDKMKRDLEAAAEIQKTLLPNQVPKVEGLTIEWLYKPCDELAGDILNIFRLDETHLGLYILDVSGHGIPAALMSVTLSRILSPVPDGSSILRDSSAESGNASIVPPALVAEKLNKHFAMDFENSQYFTLIYGILNTENNEFRFISAGHPHMVVLTADGQVNNLLETGLPIGFDDGEDYEEKVVKLNSRDRIVLYSDGITEAMNRHLECFGVSRFVESFRAVRDVPLKTGLAKTVERVERWANGCLRDDISILALEIR